MSLEEQITYNSLLSYVNAVIYYDRSLTTYLTILC